MFTVCGQCPSLHDRWCLLYAGSARHSTTGDVYCMQAVPVTPRQAMFTVGGQCPSLHDRCGLLYVGSARLSTTGDVYCMRAVPVTPRWRVNLGARWGVWSTPLPDSCMPGTDPVLTVQEARWVPGSFRMGTESLAARHYSDWAIPALTTHVERVIHLISKNYILIFKNV
jgi:hypothetical protein